MAAEDDEARPEPSSPTDRRTDAPPVADNSLGRLLALSDGVFSIAMTLLALDLTVPDIGSHPSDAELRQKLWENSSTYLSFLLSFYLVASYWMRHRRLMRAVVITHPAMIRDTLFLLLIVAAMPFPSSLLGRYGSDPISLALYGAINVLAGATLLLLNHDIRRLELADENVVIENDARRWQTWSTLAVFTLCIPAGYVLGRHGPYVLLLLAIPHRVPLVKKLVAKWRRWTGDVTEPHEAGTAR